MIFSTLFLKNRQTPNLIKIHPAEAELYREDKWTDRQDEANSRFSQLWKASTKYLDKCHTCDTTCLLFHGYRSSLPGVMRPGLDSGHSPPSSAEVKNEWNYTFTLPVRPHAASRDNFICLPDVVLNSPSMACRLVEELTVDTSIMHNELVLTCQTTRRHIQNFRQSDINKPQFFSLRVHQNIGITVIPRLTKIIRSGITFISRNLR
jgi:hypothetical protein